MSVIPLITNHSGEYQAKLVFDETHKVWRLIKGETYIRMLDEFESNFVESAFLAGQQSKKVSVK